MIGRRRIRTRDVAFFTVITGVLLASIFDPVGATSRAFTKRIPWASFSYNGAAGAIPGGLDTLFIATATDSQRTAWVPTGDWDWTDIVLGASSPYQGAIITLTAEVSNGSQDSLYFTVEKSAPNGYAGYNPTLVASSTTILIPVPSNTLGNSKVMYRGILSVASGGSTTANGLWLDPQFRLVIRGDSAGGKLSGCRLWITYIQRAQP